MIRGAAHYCAVNAILGQPQRRSPSTLAAASPHAKGGLQDDKHLVPDSREPDLPDAERRHHVSFHFAR